MDRMTGRWRKVLRILSVAALLVAVAAGCGNAARRRDPPLTGFLGRWRESGRPRRRPLQPPPRPGTTAARCTSPPRFAPRSPASRRKLPLRLRSPLLTGVNALAARVSTCTRVVTVPVQPKPPEEPKRKPEPPRRPPSARPSTRGATSERSDARCRPLRARPSSRARSDGDGRSRSRRRARPAGGAEAARREPRPGPGAAAALSARGTPGGETRASERRARFRRGRGRRPSVHRDGVRRGARRSRSSSRAAAGCPRGRRRRSACRCAPGSQRLTPQVSFTAT